MIIPNLLRLLQEHLEGHKEDCTDVIGVYPMLADEPCNFLVFDFDNHDKKKETNEEEGANLDNFNTYRADTKNGGGLIMLVIVVL